jgi:SAM-dependent methyltransferase
MGKRKRALKSLLGIRDTKAEQSNQAHWAAERQYWTERAREWYREKYDLPLAPIQTDTTMVPPFELIAEIQTKAKAHPDAFLASGLRTALYYLEALHDHGFDAREFANILDFGIGLARLIRHYYPFEAKLYGCDVTASVVDYTRNRHGDRLDVRQTGFSPPLPYDSGQFDYVYANSVFTHIQTTDLGAWIAELARITRPGGCVIVSVYSTNRYLGHISEREFDREIRDQGYIEWGSSDVRENCLYATPDKLREWWSEYFEVLELRARFKDQDQLVLRRSSR